VELLLANPQVRDFLITLSLSAAREASTRAGKWIVGSLVDLFKKSGLFQKDKLETTEKTLNELISGKSGSEVTLMKNFWAEFLGFMFPDRDQLVDKLNQELCDYIAQRIYEGMGFEQLLLDIEFQPERIRYMGHFVGRNSQTAYYFDLRASFEQVYFDNILLARVIDGRVSSPTEFVNSLPAMVEDINGDPTESPAILRDHDIIAIIQSGKLSSAQITKLQQTIRTVQTSNDIALPRLVFFPVDELESLITCGDKVDRAERMKRKLQETRRYRGIE
jgi:hypothetical protein